jgi:putative oxygen-independent coproporphyrinogen III oxidase
MSMLAGSIPLSLYIHIPWCLKKCPYCDFNSHAMKNTLPEQDYIQALLQDLEADIPKIQDRMIETIFIGGGTPSLLSSESLADLLTQIKQRVQVSPAAEITMEANPGTVEQSRFREFHQAGVNRLSIGIQSFQADKLKLLGRVHDDHEAIQAVETAKQAGFDNFNLDLMFGLPQQNIEDALFDLQTAIALNPKHISWYQLTLEPNTLFFHHPPRLPQDDLIWEIQTQGQKYLADHHFEQYEISAYGKAGFRCRHNINYWEFGDYLGIGAGAHAKITCAEKNTITRYWKTKHPKDYLNSTIPWIAGEKILTTHELPLEFMMNAMRLLDSISLQVFSERTGLNMEQLIAILQMAKQKELLTYTEQEIMLTDLGRRYLNDVLELFLTENI